MEIEGKDRESRRGELREPGEGKTSKKICLFMFMNRTQACSFSVHLMFIYYSIDP